MTARFKHCLNVVLGHEGGYVDHKNDRGGATNFGVTQATYDRYRRLKNLVPRRVSEVDYSEVEAIYKEDWDDAHCSAIKEPLDLLVFDTAINSGPGRAIKILQSTIGADVDGQWGVQTMAALAEDIACGDYAETCREYLDNRREFFRAIVRRDPTQTAFINGWMNRVDKLEKALA